MELVLLTRCIPLPAEGERGAVGDSNDIFLGWTSSSSWTVGRAEEAGAPAGDDVATITIPSSDSTETDRLLVDVDAEDRLVLMEDKGLL